MSEIVEIQLEEFGGRYKHKKVIFGSAEHSFIAENSKFECKGSMDVLASSWTFNEFL